MELLFIGLAIGMFCGFGFAAWIAVVCEERSRK